MKFREETYDYGIFEETGELVEVECSHPEHNPSTWFSIEPGTYTCPGCARASEFIVVSPEELKLLKKKLEDLGEF